MCYQCFFKYYIYGCFNHFSTKVTAILFIASWKLSLKSMALRYMFLVGTCFIFLLKKRILFQAVFLSKKIAEKAA